MGTRRKEWVWIVRISSRDPYVSCEQGNGALLGTSRKKGVCIVRVYLPPTPTSRENKKRCCIGAHCKEWVWIIRVSTPDPYVPCEQGLMARDWRAYEFVTQTKPLHAQTLRTLTNPRPRTAARKLERDFMSAGCRCIGCLRHPNRPASCRSLSAKEPLIFGLFCGKKPINIRHSMTLRHPVASCAWDDSFIGVTWPVQCGVTWPIYVCNMTLLCVLDYLMIYVRCVTLLDDLCHVTRW